MNDGTTISMRRLRCATRVIAALASIGAAATAHASTLPQFEMLAILDAPGGSMIARGEYAAAIDRAGKTPVRGGEAELWRATNLCVAHTMLRQAAESAAECDRALDLAQTFDRSGTAQVTWSRHLARAQVNRAIAYWRAGDLAAAEHQMAAAREIAPKARFVRRNVEALTARQQSLAKMTSE